MRRTPSRGQGRPQGGASKKGTWGNPIDVPSSNHGESRGSFYLYVDSMTFMAKKTVNGHDYFYAIDKGRVDGKSKVLKQIYLGSIEKIIDAVQFSNEGGAENPTYSEPLEFGAVSGLFDLSERLGIRTIIDECTSKRHQGLPIGDSIVLAAINRAVCPVSKNVFHKSWFNKTVLTKSFPLANEKNLSSQGFWNNMSRINSDQIRLIEDKIVSVIVDKYGIRTDCLLFDNTNFITYFDSDYPSALAKRGNSKEHRSDLRIIGLSLMVSPDHNIPLFHEIYPGNTNDAKRFSEIIKSLKERSLKITGNTDITLVFDRGNNSSSNFDMLLENDPFSFYFVGGLKQNQCQPLLEVPSSKFIPLKGDCFGETTAYRTIKEEYGISVTVVITYNPELFRTQMRGINENIHKCSSEFDELIHKLKQRKNGIIRKEKNYTYESLDAKVKKILQREYMHQIFEYSITQEDNFFFLSYNIDDEKFQNLKNKILGKSIIFSNRHDWSAEQIVSAYRAQYHVESSFRQMKDIKFVSFTPIRHFTDSKIIVHSFYCVLALMLCSVMNLEFHRLGHKLSIDNMLGLMSECEEIINYHVKRKKTIQTYSLTKITGPAKEYCDMFNLYKYAKGNPTIHQ
ncbi:MAG: IS1634 family transposase [Deltaproteobacteria bacterium]|jgi:transposase|nr:IS1634 family transposase [Deltaproteobacteria bacterium]